MKDVIKKSYMFRIGDINDKLDEKIRHIDTLIPDECRNKEELMKISNDLLKTNEELKHIRMMLVYE